MLSRIHTCKQLRRQSHIFKGLIHHHRTHDRLPRLPIPTSVPLSDALQFECRTRVFVNHNVRRHPPKRDPSAFLLFPPSLFSALTAVRVLPSSRCQPSVYHLDAHVLLVGDGD